MAKTEAKKDLVRHAIDFFKEPNSSTPPPLLSHRTPQSGWWRKQNLSVRQLTVQKCGFNLRGYSENQNIFKNTRNTTTTQDFPHFIPKISYISGNCFNSILIIQKISSTDYSMRIHSYPPPATAAPLSSQPLWGPMIPYQLAMQWPYLSIIVALHRANNRQQYGLNIGEKKKKKKGIISDLRYRGRIRVGGDDFFFNHG